jgi:deazaflavin-dependent oxidoreductase (nitroreductase family)
MVSNSETTELKPPRGWRKIFFKMPVFMARLGFAGWETLFGIEWMMLTTIGRKSGKKRYTMVDVLLYERETDTYIIEVGFGKESDWYRNIQANPIFEAQVRRRKFSAVAETLPPEKTGDAMANFFRRRPRYANMVIKLVGFTNPTEDELRKLAPSWILLAVHPQLG